MKHFMQRAALRSELYGLWFEAIAGDGREVEEPTAAEAAFFESSQQEAHHGDCAWEFGPRGFWFRRSGFPFHKP